jgi:hypothetical protein
MPSPRTVTVVSPPAIRQAGGAIGPRPAAISPPRATSSRAASRASPCRDRVNTCGASPSAAGPRRGGVDDELIVPDHDIDDPLEDRIVGLGRLGDLAARPALEPLAHRGGRALAEIEAVEDRQRLAEGRGIGRRRSRADHVDRDRR